MDFESILKDLFPLMKNEKIVAAANGISEELVSNSMCLEDIRCLDPSDLVRWLGTMQAKKLICHYKERGNSNYERFSSNTQLSTDDQPPSSEKQSKFVDQIVRWSRLPKSILSLLKQKKRPLHRDRLKIIRSIADDVMDLYEKPDRHILRKVSLEIVDKYPDSFRDMLSKDNSVRSGFCTILTQLENRIANVKRKSTGCSQSPLGEKDVIHPGKGDSYGCTNWEPESIPTGETLDTLEAKRDSLINIYNKGPECWNDGINEIKEVMHLTYYLQRVDVNNGLLVPEIFNRWPFLFVDILANEHFEILTRINGLHCMSKFLKERVPLLIKFFTSLGPKVKECLTIDKEMEAAIAQQEGDYPKLISFCCMLIQAFGENKDSLFVQVEEDIMDEDIVKLNLPSTPCLVTKGVPAICATEFYVIVDQTVVSVCKNAVSALSVLFEIYFILNIKYNTDIPCTLEFVQRIIMDINPEKGSKQMKKKGNRQWCFSTKVYKLVNSFNDFLNI